MSDSSPLAQGHQAYEYGAVFLPEMGGEFCEGFALEFGGDGLLPQAASIVIGQQLPRCQHNPLCLGC